MLESRGLVERRTAHAAFRQARRGFLDRALPTAGHRPRLLRGLELERKAIFAKTWLNVGRVEQLPRVGSYFTKELDAAHTSIVVVRSADQQVRAFYNMCRHRGNKLVWQDYPGEESAGTCRQFQCKYHGWRYSLEGDLTFVQQESEFFDLDKADYGLAPVRAEVWEGFIFVNLDKSDDTPLRDYLGELA